MAGRTITLKDHPKLKWILSTLGYRKHKAHVNVAESVALQGTYWDGGSRSSYVNIRFVGEGEDMGISRETLPQYSPPQYGAPKETSIEPVVPGKMVVELGVFCGKTATACITIHPIDQTRFGL